VLELPSSPVRLSAGGSCLRRTGHPFAVSGPCGPSQKIEFVFAASPETIRGEPPEVVSVAQWAIGRTWQPARCGILLLFSRRPRFLSRRTPRIWKGHEVALSSIDGEQIRDHLTSYGQRRPIGIPFLPFGLIDPGQLVVLPGR
jgi:hypothetical protein